MISQVGLNQSIADALKFLKEIDLYKGKGVKKIGDHSDYFKKISRRNKHTEIHRVAIQYKDYEILLLDDSIFQVGVENQTLRYAFIQNPNLIVTKDDFLTNLYSSDDLLELTNEELEDLKKSINEEEFEQYVNEQDLNLEAHIIRYDLDLKGYNPLVHSYSHIHIGLNENLRIPCSKILTPLNFVFFAIKNTYYHRWKKAIADDSLQKRLLHSKNACLSLPKNNWQEIEKFEFYLS